MPTLKPPREFHLRSFTDYVKILERMRAKGRTRLWYRGADGKAAELLPTIYRARLRAIKPTDTSELERELVTRFRERSLPYRQAAPAEDNLETLFFMQHYRIPTRLLDWTQNPFVGLFFAVRNAPYRRGKGGRAIFAQDAVVWVLDPVAWNQGSLKHIGYRGGPVSPGHEALSAYKTLGEIATLGTYPVALFGSHNSPRIVAQQGAFVIFGSATQPMEHLYRANHAFPRNSLCRIVIPRGMVGNIRDTMFHHGFTDGVLFPDLEGLALELRRTFGFEI